jgi:predicted nucleic acid-binding protein
MPVLVDTNVLLRFAQASEPYHRQATNSVAALLESGETVYFTFQNVAEFWNVATRPQDRNGLGLPAAFVIRAVSDIERLLTFLPDTPAMYTEWKRLVLAHQVSGLKVHDARLVAAMIVHGVDRILTFDVQDFARYHEVRAMHPESLMSQEE